MKKTFLFSCILFLSSVSIACPICGCGGSNVYMGLFPDFRRGFMGMRYNYAQYHTTLFSDPSQYSTNYYNSVEVWGGINLGSKFQVLGFIPYYSNKQVDDDGISTPHGLGDVTIIGQYKILSTTSVTNSKKIIQQQVWLGAGFKLATGSFNLDLANPGLTIADVNAQLGTGSTDFLLNGVYNISINKFGLNASASYKINTFNKQNYKYGNKLSTNLIAFYGFNAGKIGISPNAGIGYEKIAGNLFNKKAVQYTGSNVTNAIAGAEFAFNKIGVGINAQLPLSQNFAEGQTRLKLKGMAHVTFSF